MADSETIPVIDLGPCLSGAPGAIYRTAEELHLALTEIGFYFIVNHGVPAEQIHAAFRQAARFHALPREKKLEVKLDKHNVAYFPMKGNTLRTSKKPLPSRISTKRSLSRGTCRATIRRYWPIGASAALTADQLICRTSEKRSSLIATRWNS
jgi:isopenicillin N synthase-like dioxygenase